MKKNMNRLPFHIHSAHVRWSIISLLPAIIALLCGCSNQERLLNSGPEKDNVFGVGIPANVMVLLATEQHGSNWCWAASAQMALATQSVDIPQEDIVRNLFGRLVDSPGGVPHFFALTGQYLTPHGFVSVSCEFAQGPPGLEFLIETLRKNRPVILACKNRGSEIGHAVVATAVIFKEGDQGRRLLEVVVRDPTPGTGKRLLSASEYEGVTYHAVYKASPGLMN